MFKGELKNYQQECLDWLQSRSQALLALQMGLGKTIIVIAHLEKRKTPLSRFLIITPSSLCFQWSQEIKKFTDSDFTIIDGAKKNREVLWQQKTVYTIVNYEKILKDKIVFDINWDVIICDECDRLRNIQTKLVRMMWNFKVPVRYGLSGTPINNSPADLFGIFSFIKPFFFGKYNNFMEQFAERELQSAGRKTFWVINGWKNLDKLKVLISPFTYYKRKEEVLLDLPEISFTTLTVELNKDQYKKYNEILPMLWKELNGGNAIEYIPAFRVLSSSPTVYNKSINSAKFGVINDITNNKISELKELVKNIIKFTGDKIVIFSQFVEVLKEINESLKKEQINSLIYSGELNQKGKDEIIDKFKNNVENKVLLSSDSGAYGLNLQDASCVVNFDLTYNPAILAQRISRIHRIGQMKGVQVFNFVARKTIEEQIVGIVIEKMNNIQKIFDAGENEKSFTNELREVFKEKNGDQT